MFSKLFPVLPNFVALLTITSSQDIFIVTQYISATARKKIITNAWAVTITLYSWSSPAKYASPGDDNSILIRTENAVPIAPLIAPNIIYNVPISLWFVLNSHLSDQFMVFPFVYHPKGTKGNYIGISSQKLTFILLL
jgi:hypothetical protein